MIPSNVRMPIRTVSRETCVRRVSASVMLATHVVSRVLSAVLKVRLNMISLLFLIKILAFKTLHLMKIWFHIIGCCLCLFGFLLVSLNLRTIYSCDY